MSRTGHSSTDGIQAYKWTSDKLKQLTSDVLYELCMSTQKIEEKNEK